MESDRYPPLRNHVDPDVRDWRFHVLRQAGFHEPLARQLATNHEIDLHDLLKLVDRGCPPDLAARILTPL